MVCGEEDGVAVSKGTSLFPTVPSQTEMRRVICKGVLVEQEWVVLVCKTVCCGYRAGYKKCLEAVLHAAAGAWHGEQPLLTFTTLHGEDVVAVVTCRPSHPVYPRVSSRH